MDYEVQVFNFFKNNGSYAYYKGEKQYILSSEMFECMKRQYLKMGYEIFWENDRFISFSKVTNAIEVFCAKMDAVLNY